LAGSVLSNPKFAALIAAANACASPSASLAELKLTVVWIRFSYPGWLCFRVKLLPETVPNVDAMIAIDSIVVAPWPPRLQILNSDVSGVLSLPLLSVALVCTKISSWSILIPPPLRSKPYNAELVVAYKGAE